MCFSRKIFARLDEVLDPSKIEESYAQFCAVKAHDTAAPCPSHLVLAEFFEVLGNMVSSFQVHLIHFTLTQRVFEDVLGRASKVLFNVVMSRPSLHSELFGSFLMVILERLEALCHGNVWTGSPDKQVSIVKQCAQVLILKEKAKKKEREALFPDLTEHQLKHLLSTDALHHNHHSSHSYSSLSHHHTAPTQAHNKSHAHDVPKHLLFHDLNFVHPFPIRTLHYLAMEEVVKLPVPPFLIEELGIM